MHSFAVAMLSLTYVFLVASFIRPFGLIIIVDHLLKIITNIFRHNLITFIYAYTGSHGKMPQSKSIIKFIPYFATNCMS